MTSFPIKDGVVDVCFSPDEGFFYLMKYTFSTKGRWVSKASYATAAEAVTAFQKPRGVRWIAD